MSDNNTKNSAQRQEDSLNIKDLLFLYLSKWRWFVLSLIICIGVAVLYLLRTPSVYTRTATLLIEDNDKGGTISSDLNFADMGLFQSNSNVNNEIIAISSPALMQNVVNRLHLYMNYTAEGRFHDETLYGTTLPVTAVINETSGSTSPKFTIDIDSTGAFWMYDFSNVINGDKVKYKERISGRIGDTLITPVGEVVISPTAFYSSCTQGPIYVSKSSVYSAVTSYSSRLDVHLLQKEATVVSLSMEDVSVQRANDVLSTLISAYNESWVEAKNQIAVSTSAFIDERLKVIEQELGVVEEDISSYKSKNLIPDLQAASDMYIQRSGETEIQLVDLNNRIFMAGYITDYLKKEENKYQLLPAGTGIESSGIENQIAEYNTMVLSRNNMVANSSESNPLLEPINESLESLRAAILTSLGNYTVLLQTQLKSLRAQEAQATDKIAATPDQAKYLLSVERQQKVKEALYLFLLQKREENELSQAFTAYNTRIITPPTGSMAPTSPAKMQIMLVAVVLGLVIPMGIFFVIETGNTKLRGKKDLENLSVPYIGEIPLYDKKSRSILLRLPDMTKKRKSASSEISIVVREGSRDVINEAFRVVRTNLEFMSGPSTGAGAHVLMTTSFNPGSGKTFISANMAVSLAIRGERVLVIDGDMRHGSASKIIGSPSTGLSDWLSGRVEDVRSVIVKSGINSRLSILPVGTIPPNPTELLLGGRLKELIGSLRDSYEYIIIDCPPVNIVADTQILSKIVDRTVFIVRAGLLERSMLGELEDDFRENRYPGMCMVLNGTVSKGGRYGYRYGYQYGYNYGYGYYHQS
ncbi:MAG TPA: polysaccharide biosynthesis tyrosine autokinase [Candidatus Coprenecus pullistercoris]|nr:polysaccharide biosynthesis tyrosine autokinase [Candidatus Coprenecus pullistercoris]